MKSRRGLLLRVTLGAGLSGAIVIVFRRIGDGNRNNLIAEATSERVAPRK